MKFGVCIGTNVENMRYAKSLGYDYVEVHCQEIANKPIEHIEAMKRSACRSWQRTASSVCVS